MPKKYSTERNITTDVFQTDLNKVTSRYITYPNNTEKRQAEGGLRLKNKFKKTLENKPLVTIITVCFNSEKYLERCILSVLNQTYDNIEYIIIDGGSNDNTINIIKKYEHAIDYFISEPDGGIYFAMNKGLELASGDYILMLNSDDQVDYRGVEILSNNVINDKSLLWISGRAHIMKDNGFIGIGECFGTLDERSYLYVPFCHNVLFIHSSVYNIIGYYDTKYKLSADVKVMRDLFISKINGVFDTRIKISFNVAGASNVNQNNGLYENALILKEVVTNINIDDALSLVKMSVRIIPLDKLLLQNIKELYNSEIINKIIYLIEENNAFAPHTKYDLIQPQFLDTIIQNYPKFSNKKIAYIGHAYHSHTKSTKFLLDYLNDFYEIEYIENCAYTLNPNEEPNISYVDESYYAVIFFQLISESMIKQIKCKNIIFFPMYDESHYSPIWCWYMLWKYNVKIISFSKTLQEHIIKLGLDCLYIQYFIKAIESQNNYNNNGLDLFFWIRSSDTIFKWELVKKIIEKTKVESIHIHYENKSHSISTKNCPTEEDKIKFNITESKWFETKEEYMKTILSKNVYIAPRNIEGIGLSFIEAIAMGKVIIAMNAPTMNEYIIDGYNGYLFDCDKPKPIDFKNIEILKNNAYDYAKKGYNEWENNKYKILKVIDSPSNHNNSFNSQELSYKHMDHILYLEYLTKEPFSNFKSIPYLLSKYSKKRKKTFLEYIFSVYTLPRFIEIYILGIKISIKRKGK